MGRKEEKREEREGYGRRGLGKKRKKGEKKEERKEKRKKEEMREERRKKRYEKEENREERRKKRDEMRGRMNKGKAWRKEGGEGRRREVHHPSPRILMRVEGQFAGGNRIIGK